MKENMKEIRNETTRLTRILTLLSILIVLSGMAAIASADEEIPSAPIRFYGQVGIDGEWAKPETIIDAYVGEELITSSSGVDQWSRYYIDIDGDKLEDGATITFKVGGDVADKTAEWHVSTTPTSQELDLTIGAAPDSPPPEPPSTDDGSNGGGTSGGYVSPAATPTGADAQPASWENVTSAPSVAQAESTTPAETSTKKLAEKPETKGLLPGFEAVFAITGLLAVAYLIRRR